MGLQQLAAFRPRSCPPCLEQGHGVDPQQQAALSPRYSIFNSQWCSLLTPWPGGGSQLRCMMQVLCASFPNQFLAVKPGEGPRSEKGTKTLGPKPHLQLPQHAARGASSARAPLHGRPGPAQPRPRCPAAPGEPPSAAACSCPGLAGCLMTRLPHVWQAEGCQESCSDEGTESDHVAVTWLTIAAAIWAQQVSLTQLFFARSVECAASSLPSGLRTRPQMWQPA